MKMSPKEKTRTSTLESQLDASESNLNASGHAQELDRSFDLLSVVAVGIGTASTWQALGGTIVVALSNGGPPGVIYELHAASS